MNFVYLQLSKVEIIDIYQADCAFRLNHSQIIPRDRKIKEYSSLANVNVP